MEPLQAGFYDAQQLASLGVPAVEVGDLLGNLLPTVASAQLRIELYEDIRTAKTPDERSDSIASLWVAVALGAAIDRRLS